MDIKDPSTWMPFILAAGNAKSHLNMQRIFEAVLIAAISGGVATWGTQQVLVYRMQALEKTVDGLKTEVNNMRSDLYAPLVKK